MGTALVVVSCIDCCMWSGVHKVVRRTQLSQTGTSTAATKTASSRKSWFQGGGVMSGIRADTDALFFFVEGLVFVF